MPTISELTAEEYLRIQNNRNTIRAKLVELNLAVSTATLDALAAAIEGIINRGTVNASVMEGETLSLEPGYYAGGSVAGVAGGGNYTLQEKTVTPTKRAQAVTSDAGYYGLSLVNVNPIPTNYQDVSGVTATAPEVLLGKIIVLADGSVVAGTMANNGTVTKTLDASNVKYTLTAGFYAGGSISITLEEKTVTPTKSQQTITPTAGKVLSQVIIEAIPVEYQDVSNVTAVDAHVLEGDVFVDADGREVPGTMPNIGALTKTLDTTTTSQTLPEGYHNGLGKVSITLEEKTVTLGRTAQNVTPSSGKVLSKVTVPAIDPKLQDVSKVTTVAANVLAGDIFVDASGAEKEGTMPNNGDVSAPFDPLTQSTVVIPAGFTPGGTVTLTEDLLNALKAI